ncbi:MAG: alcohol dehydrogenase catalytic domain-containing protein [Armatimonadetes bacterium]|nr:alcohol dehydrogenase catalytic domain-containing protein [Armatimonadota bacterium]
MKAARLHGRHDVRIEEVPTPAPGPGEVLVRVRACAICPSDWRLYEDGHAGGVALKQPIIQGHEFAGDIVAHGEGVDSPPIGARVAVEPSWHCGQCDSCQRGLTHLCRNQVFPSFPHRDGALAEYIACPAYACCVLPEGVSYVQGALAEPLTVGLHAVRLAAPQPNDQIVILGAGMIGLSVLMCARAVGLQQIALAEPIEGRRQRAALLGADPVVPGAGNLRDVGVEGDVVFECAGEGEAVEHALYLARPAGKVVVVGIPHPERISFEADVARRRELTIIFSRRSRDELADALAMVAAGHVDLSRIPVREFPLEKTKDALDFTAARPGDALRAMVLP